MSRYKGSLLKAGNATQIIRDNRLDHSGWTPKALACLTDLVVRVPLEESAQIASNFGLRISSSELDRLHRSYAQRCRTSVQIALSLLGNDTPTDRKRADTGRADAERTERVMVLQIDGVYVLGQPELGVCPGLELTSAVLYPQSSPSDRWMIADRCSAEDFLALLSGLLKRAGVTASDTLLGLGDGAAWIRNSFEHLQATPITDVYHATEYLDMVMAALGWDELTRQAHRRDWYRGEVNARDWLHQYLPEPDLWLSWDETAKTALSYIDSRLDSLAYASFKKRGFPIGSGQVEGINKHVIGTCLKRSGMHWSEQGAASMASLRAQTCAKHPLIDFQQLSHAAYPAPA